MTEARKITEWEQRHAAHIEEWDDSVEHCAHWDVHHHDGDKPTTVKLGLDYYECQYCGVMWDTYAEVIEAGVPPVAVSVL